MKTLENPSTARKPTDSSILGSTSRKFLKETGRKLTVKKDQGKEDGKIVIKEEKNIVLKIIAKQQEKFVPIGKVTHLTVKEFKIEYLEDECEEGKYGARLIWGGKELKDSHSMSEFDFLDNPLIHVFLFSIADRVDTRKTTICNVVKTDHSKGVDFDYFVERNVASEEEVSWKRFGFHGPYIFRARFELISDYHLFMREIDFMSKNLELREDKNKFKPFQFGDYDENVDTNLPITKDNKRMVFILVILILSVIMGPITLFLIKLRMDKDVRRSVVFLNFLLLLIGLGLQSTYGGSAYSLAYFFVSHSLGMG